MSLRPVPYRVLRGILKHAGVKSNWRDAVAARGYDPAPMHVRLSKNAPPSRFYVPAGWSRQRVLEALEAQGLG